LHEPAPSLYIQGCLIVLAQYLCDGNLCAAPRSRSGQFIKLLLDKPDKIFRSGAVKRLVAVIEREKKPIPVCAETGKRANGRHGMTGHVTSCYLGIAKAVKQGAAVSACPDPSDIAYLKGYSEPRIFERQISPHPKQRSCSTKSEGKKGL
jgi:hypothetical protein